VAALKPGQQETSFDFRLMPRGDALVPVFHARPDGMPVAGVVIHPDIMGLRPLFEDMAQRLASHGFAVAVVEPFARVSAAEHAAGTEIATRFGWIAELDDNEQLDDLSAAADLLVVEDGVSNVGVLGFCMGGLYALEAAAIDRFDRAVAFYGMVRLPDSWKAEGKLSPLDTAADVCPTLAIFGSIDALTPAADIEALRAAWAGRNDCEIIVVEGADHAFVHDPDRPVHRADDAAAMWTRAIDWLKA
jgi:carboxymethylenebutenolidase